MARKHNFPKLHNAMWPGLVGKGPDSEPPIDLDTMTRLTANAEVDGVKFDGIDLFLIDPHTSIDATDDEIKALADKVAKHNLDHRLDRRAGLAAGRRRLGHGLGGRPQASSSTMVQKACRIMGKLRDLGVRPYGVIRIDSRRSPADWAKDPVGNTKQIAETFREACDVAEDHGERLAAEGEICWGGMHSWKAMVDMLEAVDRPKIIGFQADMAHTLLYTMGYNAPEARLLPEGYDWKDKARPRRGAENDDRRAAALDDRLPRRPERRHGERHRATTTRPAATAWPPTRTASSTSPSTPASGCATATAS